MFVIIITTKILIVATVIIIGAFIPSTMVVNKAHLVTVYANEWEI